MLFLGRSPTRPAPAPDAASLLDTLSSWSSESSSPEEPSPNAAASASPSPAKGHTSHDGTAQRSPSYMEKLIMATDAEAEREYFSHFRLPPRRAEFPSLLPDTSTEEESDDVSEGESVSEEIAQIEAQIRALRRDAWREVAAAVTHPSTWRQDVAQMQRGEERSARKGASSRRFLRDLRPPPPLAEMGPAVRGDVPPVSTALPPSRAAPFRFPTRPPSLSSYPHTDEEEAEEGEEVEMEVSSVSSSSEGTQGEVHTCGRLFPLQTPPAGEQVERELDFLPAKGVSPMRTARLQQEEEEKTRATSRFGVTPLPSPAGAAPSSHFLSLSPFLSHTGVADTPAEPPHVPTVVEVEVAPGNVASVPIRAGDTADSLTREFIHAHGLDKEDALVREVLLSFFMSYVVPAGDACNQSRKSTSAAAAAAESPLPESPQPTAHHAAADNRDKALHVDDANSGAAAPSRGAPSQSQPQPRRQQERSTGQSVTQRSQRSQLPTPNRLPATPAAGGAGAAAATVRHTRASRLLAQANASRQAALADQQRRETVAEFFDPYMMPPSATISLTASPPPRTEKRSPKLSEKTQPPPPPPRLSSTSLTRSRGREPLSSEQREVAAHCTFKPRINASSRRMFVVLQEKGGITATSPSTTHHHQGGAKPEEQTATDSPTIEVAVVTPSPRVKFVPSQDLSPSPPQRPPSAHAQQPRQRERRSGHSPSAVEDRLWAMGERTRQRLYAQRSYLDTTDPETGRQLFSPFLGR